MSEMGFRQAVKLSYCVYSVTVTQYDVNMWNKTY